MARSSGRERPANSARPRLEASLRRARTEKRCAHHIAGRDGEREAGGGRRVQRPASVGAAAHGVGEQPVAADRVRHEPGGAEADGGPGAVVGAQGAAPQGTGSSATAKAAAPTAPAAGRSPPGASRTPSTASTQTTPGSSAQSAHPAGCGVNPLAVEGRSSPRVLARYAGVELFGEREDVAVAEAGGGAVGDAVRLKACRDLQRVDGALAEFAVAVHQGFDGVGGAAPGRGGAARPLLAGAEERAPLERVSQAAPVAGRRDVGHAPAPSCFGLAACRNHVGLGCLPNWGALSGRVGRHTSCGRGSPAARHMGFGGVCEGLRARPPRRRSRGGPGCAT